LKAKVAKGDLGVKTKRGFYSYDARGKPVKDRSRSAFDADLPDRLLLPLVNEAVACLHEGVAADADLIDAGVIFGAGFAPFTGGPLRYAQARGVDDVVARLTHFARRFGTRFTPHEGWRKLRGGA
jgi:3-hydroxyacyl-CoA dehydrogenase/enoyl-CoA hydratase/3-hydroxybutyryl-CoA epimerase